MQIKKDYTREQIVEVAKRVFLKRGFAKTSMRDIAAGAGVGVGTGVAVVKEDSRVKAEVEGTEVGLTIKQWNGAFILIGVSFSPMPSTKHGCGFKKNGISDPSGLPISDRR